MLKNSMSIPVRGPNYMNKARAAAGFYREHTLKETATKFNSYPEGVRKKIREAGGTIRPSPKGGKQRGPIDVIELPKERITTAQLAKRFDVNYDVVLRWIKGGGLPAQFIGDQWVVYEDEINLTINEIEAGIIHDDRPKCQACGIIFEEIGEENTVVCSECKKMYKRSMDGSSWIPR